MCLIGATIKEADKSTGIGYKVYSYSNSGNIYPEFYRTNGSMLNMNVEKRHVTDAIHFGETYVATNNKISCDDCICFYQSGFHIFLDLESAILWKGTNDCFVIQVKYSKARLQGFQKSFGKSLLCVVADEIKLNKIILT